MENGGAIFTVNTKKTVMPKAVTAINIPGSPHVGRRGIGRRGSRTAQGRTKGVEPAYSPTYMPRGVDTSGAAPTRN